jgi:hypothetical protein
MVSTTPSLPAFSERLRIEVQAEIVSAKIVEYFKTLSRRERYDLATIHHPDYQHVDRDTDHARLVRIISDDDAQSDYVKYLNGKLDYRLGNIRDIQEYISFLSFETEKYSGDSEILEIEDDTDLTGLFFKAYMYITEEKLFELAAPGHGFSFDNPVRYLATVLGNYYATGEEIKECVAALKERKREPMRALPPRQGPQTKTTILPGMSFDENDFDKVTEWLKTLPFAPPMPEVEDSLRDSTISLLSTPDPKESTANGAELYVRDFMTDEDLFDQGMAPSAVGHEACMEFRQLCLMEGQMDDL